MAKKKQTLLNTDKILFDDVSALIERAAALFIRRRVGRQFFKFGKSVSVSISKFCKTNAPTTPQMKYGLTAALRETKEELGFEPMLSYILRIWLRNGGR